MKKMNRIIHKKLFFLNQTLFMFGSLIRDIQLMQIYKVNRDEALRTLLSADQELQYGNTRLRMKEFTGWDRRTIHGGD